MSYYPINVGVRQLSISISPKKHTDLIVYHKCYMYIFYDHFMRMFLAFYRTIHVFTVVFKGSKVSKYTSINYNNFEIHTT